MTDLNSLITNTNPTLTLYARNLNIDGINVVKPPFLYASVPNTIYNVSGQVLPIIFNDVIGRDITGLEIPKVKFNKAGIYKFSCDLPVIETNLTTFNTNLTLQFKVFDVNGTLKLQAVSRGTNNFSAIDVSGSTVPLIGSLSLNAMFVINNGDYFQADIVSGGTTPAGFNLVINAGSLCVSFISLI
jgi:hypothetical protein